jgi:glycosyltransferase involved in cell wall biosynthesis
VKFSVVIPTYNRRHTIGQAIDSVLAQTGGDLEIIIVDDGSSDGTLEWLANEYIDSRIRVLSNSRKKGPAGARNTGIIASTGELVALLDSDDSFLPGHLQSAHDALMRFAQVDVVLGRALYEQNGNPVEYMGPLFDRKLGLAPKQFEDDQIAVFSDDYFAHLLQYGCYFNLSTVVLRKAAAQELMNEDLRIAEDYEFWVRLSRTHGFACLKQPQIRYQIHEQNISFEQSGSAADNAPQLLKAYQIILDSPGLDPSHTRLLQQHMAKTLFDWAYRCRTQRQFREAARLHLQSMRHGYHIENLAALLKLVPASLLPSPKAHDL